MVFSLPLDLGANWIFRVTPLAGGNGCLKARRRSLWVIALVPYLTACAILLASIWPWRLAAMHLAVLVLVGASVIEVCLIGPQKIPFTCSWLPGKSNVHVTFLLSVLVVIPGVVRGAEYELQAFDNPSGYYKMLVVLTIVALAAWLRNTTLAKVDEPPVHFEEVPPWHIVTLDVGGRFPAN